MGAITRRIDHVSEAAVQAQAPEGCQSNPARISPAGAVQAHVPGPALLQQQSAAGLHPAAEQVLKRKSTEGFFNSMLSSCAM